jgi:RNA polymerase sigma factor (sigma-70 family)
MPSPGSAARTDNNKAMTALLDDLDHALAAARAGDARGFDALYRALGGPVVGYLRARSASDPDDLANEVFVRAFRTLHTFRGDAGRFRAWLFTIAHHAAIDDRRRVARRVREVHVETVPDPPGGDAEQDVLDGLARERVQRLLDQLSPDQRDVLVLRIVADLSVEQTAAVVGKSYEAVKALQRRGLASLKRGLLSEEGVPK